ncbi:Spc7 kinetochore protein-domain-containing protein [Lactarius hatsudake]|nr:Spc7 kinetochore protein-domain-containing protein [Lactarius hatsudake]
MSPTPNRRKSIAVTHQTNKPRPTHKRRPHSITPGDSVLKQLSPVSRARRSIGPRKSILKARPSLAPEDADDVTQTMDFTRDIKSPIKEYAARKSLGRRVSFASHAQVRVFEKDQNRGDVLPSPAEAGPSSQTGVPVNDENNYPGAPSMARRRSSLRRRSVAFSENGEASMDMDSDLESSPLPANFLTEGSFLQDEGSCDVSGNWDEEVDMDITTTNVPANVPANKSRKSSLGLSSLPHPGEDSALDDDPYSEDVTQGSTGDLSGVQTVPTEFTVPLNKSLRQPEPPTAEWLALRAITHAGEDSPYEPPPSDMDEDESFDRGNGTDLGEGDMDLTEAETRLRRMRESLGLTNVPQEDSFTSSEGSSFDGGDNQTVNLTSAWRRESLGTDSSSVMDLTNVQGTSGENSADEAVIRALPPMFDVEEPAEQSGQDDPHARASQSEPAPTTSANVTDLPRRTPPPVFSRPGPVFSAPKNIPPSPSKPKSPASPRKAGTAAFALPVTRPQPKKQALPASVVDEVPSRLEDQENFIKGPTEHNPPMVASTSVLSKSVSASSTIRRSSAGGLRRPSGYFAQRRSLVPSDVLNMPRPLSPRKKGALASANVAESSGIDQDLESTGRENVEPSPSLQHPPVPVEDGAAKGAGVSEPSNPPSTIPSPLPIEMEPTPESEPPAMHATETLTHADTAEEWRNNVRTSSLVEEDEGPPISIEQFFNVTGIRFLDELAAPRRSMIHQLQSTQHQASSQRAGTTLADYVVAMAVDAPQLELYSHVAADLRRWIEHSKEIYHQAEEEAVKVTPMLFREYTMADEQTQGELLQQLKLIKANNHATARSQWYDWRLQWVEQLYDVANQGFAELEQDAGILESVIQQAESFLPSLREEHARVMKELEQEESIAAEIANCDQEYLSELKATLAEQGAALNEFRAEVSEANAKLERLEEKLRDLETEKAETMASIEASQQKLHILENSTQTEALRLKEELASLEELHLWHTSRIQPDLFEFIYASRFRVHIPCVGFKPLKGQIRIAKTEDTPLRLKDQFPRFTDLTIQVAQQRLASSPNLGIKQIVQGLGDFWSGCAQLRAHFTFLSIKYPVIVEPQPLRNDGQHQGLIATAMVLLPRVRAKLYVSFVLDIDTFWGWPTSIGTVDCRIKKAYGPEVDIEKIRTAILRRMSQTTPDNNHACFLDSCIEATTEYDE